MSFPEKPSAPTLVRRPPPTAELAGRKVLIVDDDPANVRLVREGLSPQGYRFVEAADGTEALAAVRQYRPDLIVMDVQMPGLSGVEVCRIIKANSGESGFGFIPIILVTARKAGKVEGLELGADDYLIKPFDMLELSARVKSMLRLKALQDQLVEKNRELDRANRELDRKGEELLVLSRRDPLTGLFNRRYLEERLAMEFARSNRYRSPLSCVMIDVDHFKQLNDTFGHPFGDKVLQAISRVTLETMRDVDMLARYGGEELVALLPETGPVEAHRAAERVRSAIAALRLKTDGDPSGASEVSCTASLGVATFPVPGIDSADALLRTADDCLYAAKQAGRNRVKQHEE